MVGHAGELCQVAPYRQYATRHSASSYALLDTTQRRSQAVPPERSGTPDMKALLACSIVTVMLHSSYGVLWAVLLLAGAIVGMADTVLHVILLCMVANVITYLMLQRTMATGAADGW